MPANVDRSRPLGLAGEPLARVPALVHGTQDGQHANPGLASEGHPFTGAVGILHFVAGPTPRSVGSEETR
jgi:hypothetical protein